MLIDAEARESGTLQFAIEILVRAEQQQEPGGGVAFVSQQRKLFVALELVDKDAGEVAFFSFAQRGVVDDGLHGVIDIGLLVGVQALVGEAEGGGLKDLNRGHD